MIKAKKSKVYQEDSSSAKNAGRPKELFGQIAVRLGLVKPRDIEAALKIQQEQKRRHKKHKLIGLILLEMGVLDTTGLIAVLKEIQAQSELKTTIKEKVR